MNRHHALLLCLFCLLPVAGCAGFDPQQFIPVVGGGTAPAAEALPTAEPTPATPIPADFETPALMCTPPACAPGDFYACPTGDCPGGCGTVCVTATPVSGPLAPAPNDWENLESWLTILWRSNVNPAAVRAALQQSGVQRSLDDWRAADFDGDLRDEWVGVLYDPSMPGVPFGAAGDLWVVNGNGVIFRYYIAPSSDILDFLAPAVVAVGDMTGDGLPELITSVQTCGAHTCFKDYRVIGLRDGQLTDLVLPSPSPEENAAAVAPVINMSNADARLEDVNGDGRSELLVHGGTFGSAGAGIVRPRTEVWGWDGTAVTLIDVILDPTQYRHHILYEANDRMAAGDLDGALALYEAAINDGALRDDTFNYPPEQVRADVSAFAAFRLILIDLMQGNAERANGRLAWLAATYPDSAAAGAAATLVAGWSGVEALESLCDGIETGLLAVENPTGALANMGYGNPVLEAGDFCP